MKIKLGSGLIYVNVLSLLLVLTIILVPSTALRVVLGLPFILFYPGYALVTALFPRKDGPSAIERTALSFGLSIAIVVLTGLALNYMPFGIQLYSIMFSIAGFILVVSAIAELRRWKLQPDERFSIELELRPIAWKSESKLSKLLSVLLIISALIAIGSAVFAIAMPKTGERFTEFYILDRNGQATDYPSQFIISQGNVTTVIYDSGQTEQSEMGYITVGIINDEHRSMTYELNLTIDGQTAPINIGGTATPLVSITLENGQKWENQIGFAPNHVGDNQEVEFILLVDGKPYYDNPLRLWVDAKTQD